MFSTCDTIYQTNLLRAGGVAAALFFIFYYNLLSSNLYLIQANRTHCVLHDYKNDAGKRHTAGKNKMQKQTSVKWNYEYEADTFLLLIMHVF